MELTTQNTEASIVNFPGADVTKNVENIPTPKSDAIFAKAEKLKRLSKYTTNFDFEVYRSLEFRFGHEHLHYKHSPLYQYV